MTVPPNAVKNGRIRTEVNAEQIRNSLSTDPLVNQIVKQGKRLLEQTNRPNVITVEQFEPFIPMFNMDVERYDAERPMGPYIMQMNKLYNRWKNELGINLYEITIVIKSREDPTPVLYLNRQFTRIRSDKVEGMSARENIPANISKIAEDDRSQEIMKASAHDIAVANNTAEQIAIFAKARTQSALINKDFVENHMTPEKRAALLGEVNFSEEGLKAPVLNADHGVTFMDDDDDD